MDHWDLVHDFSYHNRLVESNVADFWLLQRTKINVSDPLYFQTLCCVQFDDVGMELFDMKDANGHALSELTKQFTCTWIASLSN